MYMYEPGEQERKRKTSNKRLMIAMMVFSAVIIVPVQYSEFDFTTKAAITGGTLLCLLIVVITAKLDSMSGEKHAEI